MASRPRIGMRQNLPNRNPLRSKEAAGFLTWMQNYASKHVDAGEKLSTVSTIHGDTRLPEGTLDHWEDIVNQLRCASTMKL